MGPRPPVARQLSREPVVARQVLRKLVAGRFTMTPTVTPEGRFYQVSGTATYGRIINGMLRVQSVVPPARFVVWTRQRPSSPDR